MAATQIHEIEYMKQPPHLRRNLVVALLALTAALAFLLGLRSASQKDFAYFIVKEVKIKLAQEISRFQGRVLSRNHRSDPFTTDEIRTYDTAGLTLQLRHLPRFGSTDQTAGFVPDGRNRLTPVEQGDLFAFWNGHGLEHWVRDAVPTSRWGGGVKQIFSHQGQAMALLNIHTLAGCHRVSLLNLTQRQEILRTPCLPQGVELDFNQIGGGWLPLRGGILLGLGTPSDDPRVTGLAQDPASPYGKVLFLRNSRLFNPERFDRESFELHSIGHRNPMGIAQVGESVYSVDTGPDGGDEINLLTPRRNYGLLAVAVPLAAPATPPLIRFLTSVQPSDITACPKAAAQRFAPLNCVLISSLSGQTLILALMDADQRVVSLERIAVDMQLREFVALPGERLAVSTDGYGVFEVVLGEPGATVP